MSSKINVITLFPEFFDSPLETSLVGKAIGKKILDVNIVNLRDYAVNQHGQVDDMPYGGGPGMILMVEPIDKAVQKIKEREKSHFILLTPRGKRLQQNIVRNLLEKMTGGSSLSLICGHYEGIDQRVAEEVVDESISVGDFVLSGGESAALILLEAVARLIPEFVGNQDSLETESFSKEGYIEYPQYTRPAAYKGMNVPEILLSGHHEKIKKWREENSGLNRATESIIDDHRQ